MDTSPVLRALTASLLQKLSETRTVSSRVEPLPFTEEVNARLRGSKFQLLAIPLPSSERRAVHRSLSRTLPRRRRRRQLYYRRCVRLSCHAADHAADVRLVTSRILSLSLSRSLTFCSLARDAPPPLSSPFSPPLSSDRTSFRLGSFLSGRLNRLLTASRTDRSVPRMHTEYASVRTDTHCNAPPTAADNIQKQCALRDALDGKPRRRLGRDSSCETVGKLR